MACILLDVDGVLHVSGEPIPGATEAVARLRRQGHSLRFVTNNSTRPRTTLAEELRTLGFELDDDELQTTARAAARELAGKRVFALVMGAIVPDLEGIELVGDQCEEGALRRDALDQAQAPAAGRGASADPETRRRRRGRRSAGARGTSGSRAPRASPPRARPPRAAGSRTEVSEVGRRRRARQGRKRSPARVGQS